MLFERVAPRLGFRQECIGREPTSKISRWLSPVRFATVPGTGPDDATDAGFAPFPLVLMVDFVLALVSTMEICRGEDVLNVKVENCAKIAGETSCCYNFGRSGSLDTFRAQDR